MRSFNAVVQQVIKISDQTFLVTLEVQGVPLQFVPGQYLIVLIDHEGKTARRLYSIASSSQNGSMVDLFVKTVPGGVGSTHLTSSPIGSTIHCMGPAGVFRLRPGPSPKIFMTTGTGFAPIRSFLLSQQEPPPSQWFLFWGDRTYDDVGFIEELLSLRKRLGVFDFLYCLSREVDLTLIPAHFRSYFRMGRINSSFEANKQLFDLASAEFYLCGSRLVVDGLRTYLDSLNISKDRVIFEKY